MTEYNSSAANSDPPDAYDHPFYDSAEEEAEYAQLVETEIAAASAKSSSLSSDIPTASIPLPGEAVDVDVSKPMPKPLPAPTGRVPTTTGDTDAVRTLIKRVKNAENGSDPPDWNVPLRLGRIPVNATVARSVAEKIAMIMAVRMTDCDLDAVPLAGSFVARAMGWDDPEGDGGRRARKYLRMLCDYDVLREDETMPLRGWPCGTKTYQPHDFDLRALFEGRTLTVVREEAA